MRPVKLIVTAGRCAPWTPTVIAILAGIVLAHDGGPQPNATLMQQLDRLAGSMTGAGYTLVTVRGLLAARGPGSAGGVPR